MNHHCAVQQQNAAFAACEEMRTTVYVSMSDRRETVVCPKPRRLGLLNHGVPDPIRPLRWQISHQSELLCESKAGTDLLDIILLKKRDGLGRLGLSSLQKVTSAFRILAYGTPADGIDENFRIVGEDRGFPGMLGSLDCMHWAWKNCPRAWAGQYSGRSGTPTLILEAVASYDLWIWHAYFGLPGSNNDINVLHSSNLFANLTQGIAPPACYTIQGKE